MEEQWEYRSGNQEAHFYPYGFSQGADEADGGPADSDEDPIPNPFSDSTGDF